MVAPRILVVDDDDWILRMVTTALAKRGYDVAIARDGEDALVALATAPPPDVIITDVMMPRLDGWSFVKKLRARPELAFVPVLFLTALGSDDDRMRGFRLGADDYLPKPFRFEELELRVGKALRPRAMPKFDTIAKAKPTALHGSLDQFGLSSLLVILEMERKSGVLVLTRVGDLGNTQTGRVFIRAGRIVRARLEGEAAPINQAAVFYLLTWSSGGFEFTALEVDMEDEIRTSTTALLLEGARRIDEAGA